jgi:hypothetical protein
MGLTKTAFFFLAKAKQYAALCSFSLFFLVSIPTFSTCSRMGWYSGEECGMTWHGIALHCISRYRESSGAYIYKPPSFSTSCKNDSYIDRSCLNGYLLLLPMDFNE